MDLNYQRPRKLEVEELTENYGKFIAEPLERGYGSTIGIALRRVLLSLIEGAAITSIRIEGVLHDFSLIPGVYEDVLNIILNLKTIPFKLNSDEAKMVRIEKIGPGEILASDIITDSDVEILDSNIHVAYLEEGGEFRADILIDKGVGFALSEQNYNDTLPVDFIPVDANFNPIEKVKYSILPARVGKRTDYEKLVLEVWTNASISPQETISKAGKILRDHLAIYLNYQDKDRMRPVDEEESETGMESKLTFLQKNVEAMGLSQRAFNCMKRLGVNYVFELVEKSSEELLKSKNFGQKSLTEIESKLKEFGLNLGFSLPESVKSELLESVDVPEGDSEISSEPIE